MRTLDTNDWILLNSIIYKIYTMSNIDEMREQFLEQMKMLIDYDSADFLLASPDGENKLVSRFCLTVRRICRLPMMR